MIWYRVTKFDPVACAIADRHYSRRTPGSGQFMPPGETIVLRSVDALSVFGWWRPAPGSGLESMNGLDGWTCTIFRREGGMLPASEMILAAEEFLIGLGVGVGPDGLITYVWDRRVASRNPGYCFLCAGWSRTGRSADGRKTLLQKKIGPVAPAQGSLFDSAALPAKKSPRDWAATASLLLEE
jgi:hypothetical protein